VPTTHETCGATTVLHDRACECVGVDKRSTDHSPPWPPFCSSRAASSEWGEEDTHYQQAQEQRRGAQKLFLSARPDGHSEQSEPPRQPLRRTGQGRSLEVVPVDPQTSLHPPRWDACKRAWTHQVTSVHVHVCVHMFSAPCVTRGVCSRLEVSRGARQKTRRRVEHSQISGKSILEDSHSHPEKYPHIMQYILKVNKNIKTYKRQNIELVHLLSSPFRSLMKAMQY
jgi:hypothetical protein